MATTDELRAMVYAKCQEKGIANLWPIIDQIIQRESGWNPTLPSGYNAQGTEDSWGLFQMNRAGGLGQGYSVAQLTNADFNAETALNIIAQRAKAGQSTQQIFADWTTAPAAIAAAGGGTMVNQNTGWPTTTPLPDAAAKATAAGAGTSSMDIDQRIAEAFRRYDEATAAGDTATAQEIELFTLPTLIKLRESYRQSGMLAGTEGMTGAEAGNLAARYAELGLGREQLGARYAELDETTWNNRVNAKLTELQRQLDAGMLSETQLGNIFAEWVNTETARMTRAQEAGRRAQYVQGVQEKRAGLRTTAEYFPGLEPGGFMQQIAAKTGSPATPTLRNVSWESLPDPWAAFQQGNAQMGLQENLPAMNPPTIEHQPVPGMGNVAGGQNEDMMAYIRRLLAQAQEREGFQNQYAGPGIPTQVSWGG